ncbi:hypothetical protein E1H18_1647 [Caulobacter sp. RHG1]|nr:hypothetical protein [Caulobacter sp. RHG1]
MSQLVLKTTGGNFDHVMICTVPPTLLEAVTSGVGNLSMARAFAHGLTGVRVLRYHDASIAAAAASAALSYLGRPYAHIGAAKSIFPAGIFGEISGNNIFCSALVAQVYQKAGASEFSATPVEKTTPATIERMAGLTDVTAEVFVTGLAPRNVEEMAALDGDRTPSPADKQAALFASYFLHLEPKARAIVSKYPDARLVAPRSFLECLGFLMSAHDAARSAPPALQVSFASDLASFDDAAFALIDKGEWDAIQTEIGLKDEITMKRDLDESRRPDPDIDPRAMAGLRDATAMQLKERSGAVEGIRNWGLGRSNTIDRYLVIAEKTLIHLHHREHAIWEIEKRLGGL